MTSTVVHYHGYASLLEGKRSAYTWTHWMYGKVSLLNKTYSRPTVQTLTRIDKIPITRNFKAIRGKVNFGTVPPSLKIIQYIKFLSNTLLDFMKGPLKIQASFTPYAIQLQCDKTQITSPGLSHCRRLFLQFWLSAIPMHNSIVMWSTKMATLSHDLSHKIWLS